MWIKAQQSGVDREWWIRPRPVSENSDNVPKGNYGAISAPGRYRGNLTAAAQRRGAYRPGAARMP